MCISGAPADGTNFHVPFYPDPRLKACSHKIFLAGSPADGSQRVKSMAHCFDKYFTNVNIENFD